MVNLYQLLIVPFLARKIIRNGRCWNLLLSLLIVLVSSAALAVWANICGCQFVGVCIPDVRHGLLVSLIHSTLLAASLWGALTILVAAKRSESFGYPAGVDIEGQCLALPFLLVFPGIGAIKWLAATAFSLGIADRWGAKIWDPSNTVDYAYCVAPYTNMLIYLILAVILATAHFLIHEQGEQDQLGSALSRDVARWFKMRLLAHGRSGVVSMIAISMIIIIGGFYYGSQALFIGRPSLVPLAQGLSLIVLQLAFWLVTSICVGAYRVRFLGDRRGMHAAISSTGWAVARLSVMIIVISAGKSIVDPYVLDVGWAEALNTIALTVFLLAMIWVCADVFFNLSSLLVLSRRYLPTVGLNTDTAGVIDDKQAPATGAENGAYAAVLRHLGQARLPSLAEVVAEARDCLLLRPARLASPGLLSQAGPSNHLSGLGVLSAIVLVQGLAMARMCRPILGRFAATGTHSVDFVLGAALALLYVTIVVVAFWAARHFSRHRLSTLEAGARVGRAALLPTLAMGLSAILPFQLSRAVADVIYPCALLLAVGAILRDTVIESRRSLALLAIVSVAILLGHVTGTWVVSTTHLSLLDAMKIPVVEMRTTLADEAETALRRDVQLAVSKLTPADLVDVSSADLVHHVVLTNGIGTKFYPQVPEGMYCIRIRHEVTSNAGWMRILVPLMARVTGSAKTPDDVARLALEWVNSTVPNATPLTFPLGEKFDQDPLTSLRCRRGSRLDAAILMVAALKASGVNARVPSVMPDEFNAEAYALAEYYDGETWKPCYPGLGPVEKPRSRLGEVIDLETWANTIAGNSRLTFYVQVDGIWYPYCNAGRGKDGTGEPGSYCCELVPGTYLASYIVGDTCHIKKFTLHSEE